jgi:hypothetical protein
MERLTPEMIKVIQHEQEHRVKHVQLINIVKAAKQEHNTKKPTLWAKVLGCLAFL